MGYRNLNLTLRCGKSDLSVIVFVKMSRRRQEMHFWTGNKRSIYERTSQTNSNTVLLNVDHSRGCAGI